ncbi:MAG TPA: hypothetical protein DDW34_11925 [Clostridium sp.]|nr:hypothetical protein [Clostridium sp.]
MKQIYVYICFLFCEFWGESDVFAEEKWNSTTAFDRKCRAPVVYFGQAESLWRKAKETCQRILNKREDTQCGSIMTEI